jgi:hypothetical protein
MRLTVSPFWRTPVRLAEFGMDHTPVLNEIASGLRGDFAAGGVRAELALARSATSWAFTGAAYQMATHGYLTGAGPVDWKVRKHMEDAGWQEFSVYNPTTGRYFSYKPLLTVFPSIGVAASLAEMAPSLRDGDIATVLEAATLSQVRGALDHPFWQGAADAFDALTELKEKGTGGALMHFVNSRVTSLMPGAAAGRTIVRNTTDKLDTHVTGDATGVQAELQALMKLVQSQVPGWANSLPVERNMITGEPILRGENLGKITPYTATTKSDDAVLLEIARLQGAGLPSEPPRVLGGSNPSLGPLEPSAKEGVRMTEAERSTLIDHLTGDRLGGKTLHGRLEQIMASANYQKQSDEAKGLMVRKVYQGYLLNAEQQTQKDHPELGSIVLQRRIAQRRGLMPPAQSEQPDATSVLQGLGLQQPR